MPTPTSPLLAPYCSPPPVHCLTLITSVLGATSNWLVLRFLCDALAPVDRHYEEQSGRSASGRRRRRVILVSFTRGWEFWRMESRRVGLDLPRLANERSFAFVDGLSELFSCAPASAPTEPFPSALPSSPPRPQTTVSAGHLLPRRIGPTPPTMQSTSEPQNTRKSRLWKTLRWSKREGLEALEKDIISVIDGLSEGSTRNQAADAGNDDILLIVDQPDMLLAATGQSMGVGATEMSDMIMGLREHVHSIIVTAAADSPLLHNAVSGSVQPTSLETEHASLVVMLAHQARMVMQLRELDTGVARDVSGVLRVNKGGGARWDAAGGSDDLGSGQAIWEEREALYFVQADGVVRVFGRGE